MGGAADVGLKRAHRSSHPLYTALCRSARPSLTANSFPRSSHVCSFASVPGSIYSVLDVVAEEIYEVTGYDRVLIYEFDSEWNGCVIVRSRSLGRLPRPECRAAHVRCPQIEKSRISPSFLGLHFPASDIPSQARRMYTRSRMRGECCLAPPRSALTAALAVIPDVSYRQQPIVPPMHPPLDLTHCIFRSVSPIHVQYLKNMNVGGSLRHDARAGTAIILTERSRPGAAYLSLSV